jgi:hypothetical protein
MDSMERQTHLPGCCSAIIVFMRVQIAELTTFGYEAPFVNGSLDVGSRTIIDELSLEGGEGVVLLLSFMLGTVIRLNAFSHVA